MEAQDDDHSQSVSDVLSGRMKRSLVLKGPSPSVLVPNTSSAVSPSTVAAMGLAVRGQTAWSALPGDSDYRVMISETVNCKLRCRSAPGAKHRARRTSPNHAAKGAGLEPQCLVCVPSSVFMF